MIIERQQLAYEALNALAVHIAVVDASGTIVAVNSAWSRFAADNGGVAGIEAYLGANYLDVCRDAIRRGDATAGAAVQGLEGVLTGGHNEFTLEYPCHGPGEERWFRMSATRFETTTGPRLVVAHEDITDRRRHERAVQGSERLLRSVLESLPIGVWIVDPDGRIVQGNAAGLRIWAGARFVGPREFGEYKGWWLNTGEPIAPEDWAAARAIQKGETSIDENVEIECFDKTRKIILNSAIPLYDEERRLAGAIIVNQDITARKRAEKEREAMLREHDRLRAAAEEANRMKDDFIAALSHELRTPLTAVLGWSAILRRGAQDAQTVARAAVAIERNAKVQAQLLNDTLEVSGIIRGKLTLRKSDVDIDALVGEVVETMRPAAIERGIDLVEHISAGAAIVHGDPTRLQQIVWNLVANALKFTPGGGRVEIRIAASGLWVEVSVQDTGIGIAPEFMPFVFEKFRQGAASTPRAQLGLGLGLTIVKELVELHHGTITAHSAGAGQGATFTVRLPAVQPA